MKTNPMPRDVEVEFTLIPTEHGGRSTPLMVHEHSYRPQFYYAGQDWDCVVEPNTAVPLPPGDTAIAFVSFLSPAQHFGKLGQGAAFLLREGNRIVAYGSVLRLLRLEESARNQAARDFSTAR